MSNRVVGGVDMAPAFSVLMVLFTLGTWIAAILPRKEAAPGEGRLEGDSASLAGGGAAE